VLSILILEHQLFAALIFVGATYVVRKQLAIRARFIIFDLQFSIQAE